MEGWPMAIIRPTSRLTVGRISGDGTPSPLSVAAAHEAGHALVGWRSSYVEDVMNVSVTPDGTGKTDAVIWDDASEILRQRFDAAAFCMAGAAGEFVGFGTVSPVGCSKDLREAMNVVPSLEEMIDGGMLPWGWAVSGHGPPSEQVASFDMPHADWLTIGLCLRRAIWLIEQDIEGFKRLRRLLEHLLEADRVDLERFFGPKETF